MSKRIKLRQDQFLDSGCHAHVYRISQRRVVKVFIDKSYSEKDYIKDELEGSKVLDYALPILKVIDVELPNKKKAKGLVRRYIPKDISKKTYRKIKKEINQTFDKDAHIDNFKQDTRGNIWRVDTQLWKYIS